MFKKHHYFFSQLIVFVDLLAVTMAWVISFYLRFYTNIISLRKEIPEYKLYAYMLPIILISWWIVFKVFGIYKSKRIMKPWTETAEVTKASLFAFLIFIALAYVIQEYKYSRIVILYFGILSLTIILFFRLTYRKILRYFRSHGYNVRYSLIVGTGNNAIELSNKILQNPELGIKIVGFLSELQTIPSIITSCPNVLGNYQEIASILKKNTSIDQVIIAVSNHSKESVEYLLNELRDSIVDIKLVPDLYDYTILGCSVEEFENIPIINLNETPINGWDIVMKRTFDILFSSISLLIFSPLMLFVIFAIKFSSRGPVFYRQTRIGLDGKIFNMLKFRSMKINAESETGPVWASQNDSRKTHIGKFIRATSLDELPQLFNVLIGNMSLVGPRPERPDFVEIFKTQIPSYMLRHKVKAGMTGWAQINGWRGNTSLEKRIECDLYYIKNWSLSLDFKILFSTIWKGFINKNAY